MPIDVSSLSVEKALSMALKSEKETQAVYKKLQSMVKNFVLKDKLRFLLNEEKKHQKVLKNLFEKMYPDAEFKPVTKSLLPKLSLALNEDMPVPDLLELAMEAEKVAEEFYDELSQEVNERGVQEILSYLASMEHGHYFLLKGELDLCMRDEQYFNREDFQYDMVHIGP